MLNLSEILTEESLELKRGVESEIAERFVPLIVIGNVTSYSIDWRSSEQQIPRKFSASNSEKLGFFSQCACRDWMRSFRLGGIKARLTAVGFSGGLRFNLSRWIILD